MYIKFKLKGQLNLYEHKFSMVTLERHRYKSIITNKKTSIQFILRDNNELLGNRKLYIHVAFKKDSSYDILNLLLLFCIKYS